MFDIGAAVVPAATSGRRGGSSRPLLHLLASDRLGRPLAGARIGVGALATNRQTTAVAQATIVAKVHEPLDVHRHVTAKVTFHDVVAVDRLADLNDFGVGQLVDATLRRDPHLLADVLGGLV